MNLNFLYNKIKIVKGDINMEMKTEIKEVTVFSNRARITRLGKSTFKVGVHAIEVKNLPLSIDVSSVWAKASGSIQAKILSVDVVKDYLKKVPKGKTRELLDKIEKIEDKIHIYTDEAESLNKQISHIDGVATATNSYAKSISRGQFTTEKHEKFIEFFMKNRSSAKKKLRENQKIKRDLDRELHKLDKELKDMEASKPSERYSIIIECETLNDGELNFEITYNIFNASWTPLYDFRLTDTILNTTYMGQISQKTGEDWNNVSLKLSTAPPSTGTVVPKLDPWFISPVKIPGNQYFGAPMAGTAQVAAAAPLEDNLAISESEILSDFEEAGEPIEAEYQTADIKTEGASVTYDVSDNIDVPGDGTLKKATISFMKFEPEFDYVATPIKENSAYRRIMIENNSNLTLLPGQAQLFENENYIGNSFIKLTSPKENIELFFGKDNRIRIKRELTEQQTDKKFIGDKKRIHYAYEIKVQNFTDTNQKIIIRDHIPISKHEQIKVKLENTKPDPENTDKLNRLEWVINSEIKKEYYIRNDFTIEFPTEMKISSLP